MFTSYVIQLHKSNIGTFSLTRRFVIRIHSVKITFRQMFQMIFEVTDDGSYDSSMSPGLKHTMIQYVHTVQAHNGLARPQGSSIERPSTSPCSWTELSNTSQVDDMEWPLDRACQVILRKARPWTIEDAMLSGFVSILKYFEVLWFNSTLWIMNVVADLHNGGFWMKKGGLTQI
jgi:hypothetical protein